jgi:hypothetical protein
VLFSSIRRCWVCSCSTCSGYVNRYPAVFIFKEKRIGKNGPEKGSAVVIVHCRAEMQFGEKIEGKFLFRFFTEHLPQFGQGYRLSELCPLGGALLQHGADSFTARTLRRRLP